MKLSYLPLVGALALGLHGTVQAEIYESKDAEGNPVFTDSPPAPEQAEEIDLPKTNLADRVKVPPPAPAATSAPAATTPAQAEDGQVTVIHDSRNDLLEEELERQRPREVRNAEERHEVGDFGETSPGDKAAEAAREHVEGAEEGAEGAHRVIHHKVGHHR